MNNLRLLTISIGTLITGVILYGITHHYIVFYFPSYKQHTPIRLIPPVKQKVTIFFPYKNSWGGETKEIPSLLSEENKIITLINLWLSLLQEDNLLPKKTFLQTALLDPAHQELFLSFDHNLFFKESNIYAKYLLVHSLCKTLQENNIQVSLIRFLVNHHPLKDFHLDFSKGWPLTEFSHISPNHSIHQPIPLTTLILNPVGDPYNVGRVINNAFERTISRLYAQTLKKELENQIPHIRVILTPFSADDNYQPLQNASFANCVQADWYISFHFFKEKDILPHWYLYYFMNNPLEDAISSKNNALQLTPYYQAHQKNLISSSSYAHTIYMHLNNHSLHTFYRLHPPQPLPFKPVIGITAPVLAFEIGLKETEDWKLFIQPVVDSIKSMV
jgi:hypothetical protein